MRVREYSITVSVNAVEYDVKMKKRRGNPKPTSWVGVLIVGTILVTANVASAQVDYLIEIANFPRAMTTQRATQWCWAAALESVLRNYGITRTQEQIVIATYGRLIDAPAYSPHQLYNVLNNFSFADGKTIEIVAGNFGNGAPPAAFLASELAEGNPVIAWYRNDVRGGHAVVIFGVRVTRSAYGPIVTAIKYHDPWPGSGVRTVPAAQLASRMTNYFVVRGARVSTAARVDRRDDSDDSSSDSEQSSEDRRQECEDKCDRAEKRCERDAERAVRRCVEERKSYEWRACGCPSWRTGDFQCYGVCSAIYEEMKSCASDIEDNCSDDHDECVNQCR